MQSPTAGQCPSGVHGGHLFSLSLQLTVVQAVAVVILCDNLNSLFLRWDYNWTHHQCIQDTLLPESILRAFVLVRLAYLINSDIFLSICQSATSLAELLVDEGRACCSIWCYVFAAIFTVMAG